MAYIFDEPSRTFNEYLLVPGYSSKECRVDNVSLKTTGSQIQKGRRICYKNEYTPGICHYAGGFGRQTCDSSC